MSNVYQYQPTSCCEHPSLSQTKYEDFLTIEKCVKNLYFYFLLNINLDLSDTVVQMSGSTCSNTRRQLPEMQESQDTKIQEFFYIPSRVDQLQKESTVNESEKDDDHPKDVEDGFDDTNPVDSENAIDIETDNRLEFDGVDKTSSDLVLPKEPPKKYLYSYFVPQLIFHPISHPMFMPYNRPQPYHYHPLCIPYC